MVDLEAFADALLYAKPATFFLPPQSDDHNQEAAWGVCFGHYFPVFLQSVGALCFRSSPAFKGVPLLVTTPPHKSNQRCCIAQCGCSFLNQSTQSRSARQTTWRINDRRFQIPAWSGRGFLHPPCPDGIAPVRLHYAPKGVKAPLGVRGRFKRGCCVQPWIHDFFVEVDAGLRALVQFS